VQLVITLLQKREDHRSRAAMLREAIEKISMVKLRFYYYTRMEKLRG